MFAEGGVARLPILALESAVRFFLSLPLLLPDGREMLVGRLDLPVLGFPRSPFEPPGQGGRREGKEQEEGNKKLLIVAPRWVSYYTPARASL